MTTTATTSLTFVASMPGLPEHTDWSLHPVAEDSPFLVMTSAADENVSFIVVEPGYFYPDFNIELDDVTQEQLELTAPSEVTLYVILTLGETLETTTANLLGPLVVNNTSGASVQMIRTQTEDTTKEPLHLQDA